MHGNLVESTSGHGAAADLSDMGEVSPGKARAQALRRQRRLSETDDIIRHLRSLKGGRRDVRK